MILQRNAWTLTEFETNYLRFFVFVSLRSFFSVVTTHETETLGHETEIRNQLFSLLSCLRYYNFTFSRTLNNLF